MHVEETFAHSDSRGRRVRFEAVYAANYESILAYARRRTHSCDDAADVVAETFLTAWRRLDQVPDNAGARLWLYGVARNILANHRRGQRRYLRLGARLRTEAVTAESIADAAADDRAGMIAAAFNRLRPNDQEILALVAVDGLTPNEIAQVLQCGATTVRVRLHRARTRFARELKSDGVDV